MNSGIRGPIQKSKLLFDTENSYVNMNSEISSPAIPRNQSLVANLTKESLIESRVSMRKLGVNARESVTGNTNAGTNQIFSV